MKLFEITASPEQNVTEQELHFLKSNFSKNVKSALKNKIYLFRGMDDLPMYKIIKPSSSLNYQIIPNYTRINFC